MDYQEAVEEAALQSRQDIAKSDGGPPSQYGMEAHNRCGRAQRKARAELERLKLTDPDFDGIELTKVFAYPKPPKEYYRAQVDVGISLFQLPAVRAMPSAELKASVSKRIPAELGYTVPKNCCNKRLFDWQLDDIASAIGISLDRKEVNSLCRLQAYADALASGDPTWKRFHLSGYYSNEAVAFTEGCRPGRSKMSTTNKGYPIFKRNGQQFTFGGFKKLLGHV